jgi:hypothetical protein
MTCLGTTREETPRSGGGRTAPSLAPAKGTGSGESNQKTSRGGITHHRNVRAHQKTSRGADDMIDKGKRREHN